jgi:high-affinity Fe2+/Pb2+ permease
MNLKVNVPKRFVLFASVLLVVILFSVSAESALTLRDNGDVTWYGYDGNDYEIFLYSNGSVIQLTDNDYGDYLVT